MDEWIILRHMQLLHHPQLFYFALFVQIIAVIILRKLYQRGTLTVRLHVLLPHHAVRVGEDCWK